MDSLQTLKDLMGLGSSALGLQQQQQEVAQGPMRSLLAKEQAKTLQNRNALAPYELKVAQREADPEQQSLANQMRQAQMANLIANAGAQSAYGLPPGFAEKLREILGLSPEAQAQPLGAQIPPDIKDILSRLNQTLGNTQK